MKFFPLAVLILTLIAAGTINVFAVHFGASDPRPLVRIASVGSGLLSCLCFLITPGAFLRFLVSEGSIAATQSLILAGFAFTAISLILSIAIAIRLRGNAA